MVLPIAAIAGAAKLAKGVLKKTSVSKIAGKVLGVKKKKHSRRGLNINRYANRLIKAKLDAKVMKQKLSVIKGL